MFAYHLISGFIDVMYSRKGKEFTTFDLYRSGSVKGFEAPEVNRVIKRLLTEKKIKLVKKLDKHNSVFVKEST